VDDYDRMPHVADRHVVAASRAGFVTGLDAALVGRASVALGPAATASRIRSIRRSGSWSSPSRATPCAGDPVLEMHYRDRARLDTAIQLTSRAITIGDAAPRRGA
jgi:thymidine phosphorylase